MCELQVRISSVVQATAEETDDATLGRVDVCRIRKHLTLNFSELTLL